MDRCYLIRYGFNSQVGRFSSDEANPFDRGDTVVIRSWRGTELGEVLIEAAGQSGTFDDPAASAVEGLARILRKANADDLETARRNAEERETRFATCSQLFLEGSWPIELIDVEPLLDDRRTVLHYLGPHKLDTAGLLNAFRSTCDLDLMFQPVGLDVSDPETDGMSEPEATEPETSQRHGCGSCGSKGGGGGCGSSTGSGCGSCSVKNLIAARR